MYELMNCRNKFHLYYLIVNDIKEEKYNGLSHVAEHTLLFSSEQILQFWGKGYTFLNHVCLYYTCNSLDILKDVDRKIMSGEIITPQNVNCAKQQVIDEMRSLAKETRIKQERVGFITDGRIRQFSMGNAEQVTEIRTEDVSWWFHEKQQKGRVFRYLFNNAHHMILSTPIPTNFPTHLMKREQNDIITEDRVFQDHQEAKPTVVKMYFKIPAIYKKDGLIKKALFEYCIQRKLNDALSIDAVVTDEYFDNNERFSVLCFRWDGLSKVMEIIELIRRAIVNISLTEFLEYKKEYKIIMFGFIKSTESNSAVVNEIKKWILYQIPRIEIEDIGLADNITYDCFPREWIIRNPLRIIIN